MPSEPLQGARGLGWVARGVAPLALSLVAHAAIVGVVVLSGWSFGGASRPGGSARTEVRIDLPQPAERESGSSAPRRAIATPTVAVVDAAPRLTGLTTPTVGAAPSLRSAAGEWGPSDLGAAAGAKDGLRREGDAGLGATFAGLGAKRAANVVYVVDASGGMVSSLRFVVEELNRSVGRLSGGQKFGVVVYRELSGQPGAVVFDPARPGSNGDESSGLVPATAANKATLRRWLAAVRPGGRSNPLEGLQRGLRYGGDAVFLLCRSIRRSGGSGAGASVWGRGPTEVLAELDRLNPVQAGQRRAVIKAIQFLEDDPTGVMQAIGAEHGDGADSYKVLPIEALTPR